MFAQTRTSIFGYGELMGEGEGREEGREEDERGVREVLNLSTYIRLMPGSKLGEDGRVFGNILLGETINLALQVFPMTDHRK